MRILIGCEFSGVVRRAFRARGHEAYSCDLLPAEDDSPFHFQTDVRSILYGPNRFGYPFNVWLHADDNPWSPWDMLIAHPPCTYLANSGVRWLFEKEGRWKQLDEAAEFFLTLLNAPIRRVAVENPIPHKWALERIGRYSQKVQPWYFGDEQKKATCLWLRNLPPLMSTLICPPPSDKTEAKKWEKVWREPLGKEQAKNRSRSFQGLADAIAEQWGNL